MDDTTRQPDVLGQLLELQMHAFLDLQALIIVLSEQDPQLDTKIIETRKRIAEKLAPITEPIMRGEGKLQDLLSVFLGDEDVLHRARERAAKKSPTDE